MIIQTEHLFHILGGRKDDCSYMCLIKPNSKSCNYIFDKFFNQVEVSFSCLLDAPTAINNKHQIKVLITSSVSTTSTAFTAFTFFAAISILGVHDI